MGLSSSWDQYLAIADFVTIWLSDGYAPQFNLRGNNSQAWWGRGMTGPRSWLCRRRMMCGVTRMARLLTSYSLVVLLRAVNPGSSVRPGVPLTAFDSWRERLPTTRALAPLTR